MSFFINFMLLTKTMVELLLFLQIMFVLFFGYSDLFHAIYEFLWQAIKGGIKRELVLPTIGDILVQIFIITVLSYMR